MAHQYDPATGTYRDNGGTSYSTPTNQQWQHDSPATSYKDGQRVDGRIVGGYFVPNSK